MSQQMQQQGSATLYSNQQYVNEGVVKLRIDAAPTLEKIQTYLKGKVTTYYRDQDGRLCKEDIQHGEPKVNDEGFQDLMNFMENILNPMTVQGNFDQERLSNYLKDCHDDLNKMIFCNAPAWAIKAKHQPTLTDSLMKFIEPYMTRLLNNLERESYAQTIKSSESSTVEQGKKGIWPF